MVKVEKLSYEFPQKELYKEISFTIEDGKHCALIGTSGTGKSTLIGMLRDREAYLYDGKIEMDANSRIGYVSQFSQFDEADDMTVFAYASRIFVAMQAEIDAICKEMEAATEFDELMERFQTATDAFQAIDGDNYESSIRKELKMIHMNQYEEAKMSQLSGGERKLIQVMTEMLTIPDLLIMDEPDVFLDFEHLNGLRDLINAHKGTLLVITHNRYLLNHCFDKILHLENMELQEFDGSYIEYNFTLLQTKIELQELAAKDQEEIERNEKMIEKLRKEATMFTDPSRGKALHARVSLVERLEQRKVKAPFVEIKQPDIRFSTEKPLQDVDVLTVNDYQVSFDEQLLEHVSFAIHAGEKVALVGPNGTGKTTLLKEIYQNNHDAVLLAPRVETALLSQLQGETLTESNTIMQEMYEAGFASNTEVNAFMAQFGFPEEQVAQKIEMLSGGEKNLVQIAKIMTGDANFLLLDEPTSHLDTYSQLALEKAIGQYNGTLLMVSHDFYFIANCMDYVLMIEDRTIRKVSIRKFRKMIYENHFDKDYLEKEQKKKEVELKVEQALAKKNFEVAQKYADELETIIKSLG